MKIHELASLTSAVSWEGNERSWIVRVVNLLFCRIFGLISERNILELKVLQIEVVQIDQLDVSIVDLSSNIIKIHQTKVHCRTSSSMHRVGIIVLVWRGNNINILA